MSRPGTYGPEQKRLRRALLPDAYGRPCPRCGRPMLPGQPLDLDHTDDRGGYLGMAHARCNRAAGARLGNARRRAAARAAQQERRVKAMEVTLGIEISEARDHCAVVAAGYLPGNLILLDLLGYLAGTDPVELVVTTQRERDVLAVVVDPHSAAATAIRPLEAAGIEVTQPTSSDLVVAHGAFLDALAAGRIRHLGQLELTAAMRHLQQRRLGGATAPERRGARVDVSPAVGAELAAWALETVPRVLPAIY